MSCGKITGFTLLELLVVIAIIAILIAILIPGLRLARAQAGSVACQARLRQWGIAFKMYTDENNGRWMTLPFATTAADTIPTPPAIWLEATMPFWQGTARGVLSSSDFQNPIELHLAACPVTKAGDRVLLSFSDGYTGRRFTLAISYSFNGWLYPNPLVSSGTLIAAYGSSPSTAIRLLT